MKKLWVHGTIMMVPKILIIVMMILVCIWRQLEKEGGSEFSFFRQDGSGIIAVRRGGFLKRNNSWRSCRNKTLHNGCHKLKLKKNTIFFLDKTEAISAIRNEITTYFFGKILSYLFENLHTRLSKHFSSHIFCTFVVKIFLCCLIHYKE